MLSCTGSTGTSKDIELFATQLTWSEEYILGFEYELRSLESAHWESNVSLWDLQYVYLIVLCVAME